MYRNRYIIVAILMAMLCQVCVRAEIYTLDKRIIHHAEATDNAI